MRVTGNPRAVALLCLGFLFNSIVADVAQPARREESTLSTRISPSKTLTDTGNEAASQTSFLSDSRVDDSATTWLTRGTTSLSSTAALSSIIMNRTLLESPVPEDDLPLDPQITPGFAVAGVILVCTGAIYALVGIKTRWIHSFLSSAFLGSLGTSVLIVYVMTPPVGNAIQGAYVVAVTCTGLILGGLALVFKEITECLACLLGGFCLSMWLLTLQPGGLIRQTGGKVAFIAAFSLAGFGLYFTPWTRNYGMIACISFAGATVAVLGIDCFSRAGYKEFWAYIWALNDDLFLLGTTTYPLTRGIRVEIAVTILIFLAGVVSQLKLWRIIKDRRKKRDAERAEGERTLRAEEENVGRQIEAMTVRERGQWERIYGDGAVSPLGNSADSGVGDMGSEKRIRHSSVTSAAALGTRSQSPAETYNGTRMLELPLDDATTPFQIPRLVAAEQVISEDDDGTRITVMVAQDDMPSGPIFEKPALQQVKGVELSPNITPLPFTIPEERTEERTEEERSSIATFADEDEAELRREIRNEIGDTVMRRLSSGSAKLFRSLSQRSKRNNKQGNNNEAGDSREDLVELAPTARGESDSVGANLDDLSCISDRVSFYSREPPKELELDTRLQATKVDAKAKTEALVDPSFNSRADATLPEPAVSTQDGDEKSLRRTSIDSVAASLTRGNLPSGLSRVAMSYRTNEWAKHLSVAETPEPETLQVEELHVAAEAFSEVAIEGAAPLDLVELQQTAENAAPPPAAPRSASAMSNYVQHDTLTRSSSSLSGYVDGATPDLQARYKTPPYRTLSGTLKGKASGLLAQPIAEEGDVDGVSHTRSPGSLELSTSVSTSNLSMWLNPQVGQSQSVQTNNSPQTLMGMREMLLRTKASANLLAAPSPEAMLSGVSDQRPPSSAGSIQSHYMYAGDAQSPVIDADDIPLSQRRALMRQSSLTFKTIQNRPYRSQSGTSMQNLYQAAAAATPRAEAAAFDSHQPSRKSNVPTEAVRQAQLANFRNSVAADLRAASPIDSSGRDSPLMMNPGFTGFGPGGPLASASMNSLGSTYMQSNGYGRDSALGMVPVAGVDVQRSIDTQRNFLLGQKQAEMARKEAERAEVERGQREFDERMRSGAMLGAHRDAMRRMQARAKE